MIALVCLIGVVGIVVAILLREHERDAFPEQVPVDESPWEDWEWDVAWEWPR